MKSIRRIWYITLHTIVFHSPAHSIANLRLSFRLTGCKKIHVLAYPKISILIYFDLVFTLTASKMTCLGTIPCRESGSSHITQPHRFLYFSLWTCWKPPRQYITTIILSFSKSMIATARLTQNIQKYFTFRETIIILIFKTFYLLTLSLKTVKGESLWCSFFLLMRDKVVKKIRKGVPVDFQYIQFWISFLNQDLDLPSWFSLTLNSLFSLYFIHLHIAESQSHYTFDS